MNVFFLVHPETYGISAEFFPGPKPRLIIHEQQILNKVTYWGVRVSKQFQEKYGCESIVYPSNSDVFPIAFKEFAFRYSFLDAREKRPQYFWREKTEFDDLSPFEAAKRIVALYQQEVEERLNGNNPQQS